MSSPDALSAERARMNTGLTSGISIGAAALLVVIVVMAVVARRPSRRRLPRDRDTDAAAVWLHGAAGEDRKGDRDPPVDGGGDGSGHSGGDDGGDGGGDGGGAD